MVFLWWGFDIVIVKFIVVVGLNGLYDLVGFIIMLLFEYVGLRDVYEEFICGVFGDDEIVWKDVCFVMVVDWISEW